MSRRSPPRFDEALILASQLCDPTINCGAASANFFGYLLDGAGQRGEDGLLVLD